MIRLPKPRILFKYRKFDKSSLELLLNRELWFAKADTLNDPFEASSAFSNVLNAVWEHYPMPLHVRVKYEEALKHSLQTVGICSFSKARKNQLMWSHYADEHKDICIGFKEEYLRESGVKFFGTNVEYQDNYPFDDIIKRIHYFEKGNSYNGLDNIAGDILLSILTTKYTSWKYERERRLIVQNFGARKFEPLAVNSIALGLRMNERDKKTLQTLLSGPEWSHLKWFQSTKSSTKYSLDFIRIG
ncbi:DUF2971 domain-containing protein [Klebsiella pneumoniae]|uniref:DUF2971 domain-containing protein n=1 Tax=Klebsiella pneumoniae TaxID=573 RepID=UPI00115C2221|nr:DUF2971 domain-containing protein [Klebsiella pneumoniae]